MSPISALERERVRRDLRAQARLKQAVKIATTAGYAAFGAAFFEPVVENRAWTWRRLAGRLSVLSPYPYLCGTLPRRMMTMSAIDILMSIVAVATTGLFIWMEALRRERVRLTAEIDRLREARRGTTAQAE